MAVLLFVLLEVGTIVGTFMITVNGSLDIMVDIFKKGYKFDAEVLNQVKEQNEVEEAKEKDSSKKIIGKILLFVPVVNMIRGQIGVHKLKSEIMDELKRRGALVPMTEEEKEQFASIKGKKGQLAYIVALGNKKEEEKVIGLLEDGTVLLADIGLLPLYESLTPLAYSLDDVKKLNAVSGGSFAIGNVDGRNVAIVGIDPDAGEIKRLSFEYENGDKKHDFVRMSEEEAEGKRFLVYPYSRDEKTQEKLDKVVEEIRTSRTDGALSYKKNEIRLYEQNYTPLNRVEAKVEEGPVLRKAFNPNRF